MNDSRMSFVEDNAPVDPERTLIVDYLCHELPVAEALAVEARLENDPAFRARVQPIIDIWRYPITYSTPEEILAMQDGVTPLPEGDDLTDAELEEGWNTFLAKEGVGTEAVSGSAPATPTLTLVSPAPAAAAPTPGIRRGVGRMQRMRRWTTSIAAGIVVFIGIQFAIAVPVNRLDHEATEAPHEWLEGWFHRTIVQRGMDIRRIELDGGSVVTLSPQSQLVYRRVVRVPGEVLNLQGSAIIEISGRTASATLYTPQARVHLTPGRYVVRSVDEHSPMVIGVLAGSATLYPRSTRVHLDLSEGQYGQAVKDHAPVLLPAAPPGLPVP